MTPSLIVACSMLSYDLDAYNVKLAELDGVVDVHHVVQGDKTFRGNPRDPVPLPAGVVGSVVPMPDFDESFIDPVWPEARGAAWQRDKYLRDASLTVAADKYGPDAFYLVADGDEIPHPDAVLQAVAEYPQHGPRTLLNDYREWYANWRAPDGWQPPYAHRNQPIIGKPMDYRGVGAHVARASHQWPTCDATGWHLSNLGNARFVAAKFTAFAHAEVDNDHDRDLERLTKLRDLRKDCIDRFDLEVTTNMPSCIHRFPQHIAP